MNNKLWRPDPDEDAEIAIGIASDPDAAPDMSTSISGIVRRVGRPIKADPKVSVTLRLDRDVIDRFKATGRGWQTRINEVLKRTAAP